MKNIASKDFVRRLTELAGGRKELAKITQDLFEESDRVWDQDVDSIGRILRAHIAVEYHLTNYLQHHNPNLGSLSNSRLTFAHKVALFGVDDIVIKEFIPGILRLNKIRNRLAHSLKAEITSEDRAIIMSNRFYKSLRGAFIEAGHQHKDEALDVIEHFASMACSVLGRAGSPFSKLVDQAAGDLNIKNDLDA